MNELLNKISCLPQCNTLNLQTRINLNHMLIINMYCIRGILKIIQETVCFARFYLLCECVSIASLDKTTISHQQRVSPLYD